MLHRLCWLTMPSNKTNHLITKKLIIQSTSIIQSTTSIIQSTTSIIQSTKYIIQSTYLSSSIHSGVSMLHRPCCLIMTPSQTGTSRGSPDIKGPTSPCKKNEEKLGAKQLTSKKKESDKRTKILTSRQSIYLTERQTTQKQH